MNGTGAIRLGISSTTAARGGAEEHLLTMAEGAVAAGWRVTVFSEHVPETASLIQDYQAAGATCLPLRIAHLDHLWAARGQKGSFARAVWRAVRAFRRQRPDVLLIGVQWLRLGLPLMVAAALLRIPAVVVFQLIARAEPLTRRERRIYRWARSRGQQWVAISRNNRALLSQSTGVPEGEIDVIYLGPRHAPQMDTATRQAERETLRRELGLPGDATIMLTVGRLHVQKGHTDLIRALPHLVHEFPGLHAVWAGDGPLRSELERQIAEFGLDQHVSILGYRADISRLLAASDLFVLPTRFEGGQSIAVSEAMLAGIPVVAARASGVAEVLEDRVHGLLVRTEDPCDLLMAVRWALLHPDEMTRLAVAARDRVNLFSAEVMVRDTLALLARQAGQDRNPVP